MHFLKIVKNILFTEEIYQSIVSFILNHPVTLKTTKN